MHEFYSLFFFQNILSNNNYYYEGAVWRKTAQSISKNNWFKQFDCIVFAGFYALTKSEEVIIDYLIKNNNAIVYKDADTYYANDKKNEAGIYLRRGVMANAKNFIGDDLSQSSKKINIIKSNGGTAMAKDIGLEIIEKFEGKPANELSNAVIVLPDDSQLIPLLQVLEKKNIPYNPSMGLALASFPLMTFIKKIKSIRSQILTAETNIDSIVTALFELQSFNNLFMILHKSIDELKASLLVPADDYLQEHTFIIKLLNQFVEPKEYYQKQILNCIKNEIDSFGNLLKTIDAEISISSYWTLLINHLNKIRIPIEANEGEGININGFLETRLTDYNYVFISNVNEGTLPSNSISKSLIPYAIRKFYSLPCKEEQEAVTAYHFYRLIQRCDELSLFYSSEMSSTGGGEKSRFILQIENELALINKNIQLHHIEYQTAINPLQAESIVIHKSDEIIQKLLSKYVNVPVELEKGKGFSASSLSSYINCSLKFYFENIARLKSQDDTKVIDPMIFGRILHKAMEMIYENNKIITADFYTGILNNLDTIVREATKQEFSDKALIGNDYLLQGVIKELIRRIIQIDSKVASTEIIAIEDNFTFRYKAESGKEIFIRGIFDRLDIVNDQIRILDYKTGSGKIEIPKDLTFLFINSDFKIVFQLLLYVYIFKNRDSEIDYSNKEILAGAYMLKKNAKTISFIAKGKPVPNEIMDEFEYRLKGLIDDILNPEKPFVQTEDYKKCGYCDFKNICNR